jgi:RNA polymerase sigma-70 factor (ECF subfamily)
MSAPDRFAEFIRRIRAGEDQAAEELVRQYEPLIRREVRLHLQDRRLARLFDSVDVCQEVMASFFARAAVGQYELERPEQVVKLLVTMARNKLASAARRQHNLRRDVRRDAAGPDALEQVAAAGPTPSQIVAGRELLAEVRRRLSDEERQLADLRGEGFGWADVAARLGGSAQARRVQLARCVGRVLRELGLEEEVDA